MAASKTKTTGIASWLQEDRPRERLLSKGAQVLTDAELVAILIRVGFKGTNAVEMARQLLMQLGSLRAMVEAPIIALLEVKGLKGGEGSAVDCGDGSSQFSGTLEQHNRAVNRYQK